MHMARKDVLKGRSIVSKNIFDTANQSIDEIKRANPIVSYFESKGVKLTKSGDEYKGLCPFHDDHNPSLSVNDVKQVFKCFGCGKAGTVIDAVSLFENISIGEAVKLLGSKKQTKTDDLFLSLNRKEEANDNQPDNDLKLDLSDIEEPEELKEDEISLTVLAGHWHKDLYNHQEALDYLHKRGITNPEIIQSFKIGFSDGKSLLKKLSKSQMEQLKNRLIIKGNGMEAFANCLIFPIFDEAGVVVHFYARNIDDKAKVKHLYLAGNHKSVFNRKVIKAYTDRLILTESIIDALSLIQLGINNVWSCYGVQSFTDEMLNILKEHRVKEIVIAFDNDDAGRKGEEKLKERLIENDFTVRSIFPQNKKDWNEELITRGREVGGERFVEEIKELIENAEIFKPKASPDLKLGSIDYEVKQGTYYFKLDELTYRIMGFNKSFTTELKVNIRVYRDELNTFKVLNLYNENAFESFVRNITEELSISGDIVRNHFKKIILFFEDEREKYLNDKGKRYEKEIYVLSATEEKKALDILTGSDLIKEHLLPDTERIGLVGEIMNKIISYHAIISRLWRKPVNIFTLSMYGMGKSFLHDTMHRFVPDEDLKDYSRITKNDLYYREEENAFVNKVLSVDEVEGIADSLYSIRTLISKGYLSISYPAMDPVSGKLRNEENKVFGRPSVFVTGTNHDAVDEETLSRFAVCTTDASNDQRLKIKQRQLFEMTRSGLLERRMEEEIVKKHKNILRMIKKVEVIFPDSWHDKLVGIEDGDYTVRNNLCYLSFIASSAIRDQYNRKIYTGEDGYGKYNYVEVTKDDVKLANMIMLELFGKRVMDLRPPQKVFLESVQKYIKSQIKGKNLSVEEVSFYEMDVRKATKLSASQVSQYLNDLIKLEYIVLDGRGKHNKKQYKLTVGEIKDESEKYLSGLIDPDRL